MKIQTVVSLSLIMLLLVSLGLFVTVLINPFEDVPSVSIIVSSLLMNSESLLRGFREQGQQERKGPQERKPML